MNRLPPDLLVCAAIGIAILVTIGIDLWVNYRNRR